MSREIRAEGIRARSDISIGIGVLLLAWLVIAVIPSVVMIPILRETVAREREALQQEVQTRLKTEMEDFKRDLNLSSWIDRMAQESTDEWLKAIDQGEDGQRASPLFSRLIRGLGLRPRMMLFIFPRSRRIGWYAEPGLPLSRSELSRMARMRLEEILTLNPALSEPINRLCRTVSGPNLQISGHPAVSMHGFQPTPDGGTQCSLLKILDSGPGWEFGRTVYLVMRQRDIPFDRVVRTALKRPRTEECRRLFLFHTNVNGPKWVEDRFGWLYLEPMPIKDLTKGAFSTRPNSFSAKLRKALNQGKIPALGIRFEGVRNPWGMAELLPKIEIVLLAGNLLFLIFAVRFGLMGISVPLRLRGKLITALLIAAAIPLGGLLLATISKERLQERLDRLELRGHIQRRLNQFERSLAGFDDRLSRRMRIIEQLLAPVIQTDFKKAQQLLEKAVSVWQYPLGTIPEDLDTANTYMFRNDGEEIPLQKSPTEQQMLILFKSIILQQYFALERSDGPIQMNAQLERLMQMGTVAESLGDGVMDSSYARESVALPRQIMSQPFSTAYDKTILQLLPGGRMGAPPAGFLFHTTTPEKEYNRALAELQSHPGVYRETWRGKSILYTIFVRRSQTLMNFKAYCFPLFHQGLTDMRNTGENTLLTGGNLVWDRLNLASPSLLVSRLFATSPFVGVGRAVPDDVGKKSGGGAWFLFTCALGTAIVVATLLARQLGGPLHDFLWATAETERGNYRWRLSEEGTDEFSEMAGAFNLMARGLMEREQMTRFVSSDVLEAVKSTDEADLAPGGSRVRAVILFAGVRGFGARVRRETPEQLIGLLNRHFTEMEACLRAQGGVIDKFIGDAVMAVFRDRPEDEDSGETSRREPAVLRASRAALAMAERAGATPGIEIGIGVAAGEVIAGRIGSSRGRLDMTVIGNPVNLAARLEQQAMRKGANCVLVDPAAIRELRGRARLEFLGRETIKGRNRTFPLYALVSLREKSTEQKPDNRYPGNPLT
ncbi:MAG: adenylate/guanylate cyclase domain-containing protein [Candidatus Ozemobacteraceae bacterium]